MELIFNKSDKYYVSEFQVTANFNLHIEKPNGDIRLYQRTAGGKYDSIDNVVYYAGNSVFDYDFNALVYPKFIKIVSETEPTYAEVVSDGEITEIKSQTKEVEVTANGTTQVAPDAGYSYLTGVTVKTNVPQSGGSGGGGSTMEYLDMRGRDMSETINAQLSRFALLRRVLMNGIATLTAPAASIPTDVSDLIIQAIGVDFSVIIESNGATRSLKDMLTMGGITEAELAAIPRITKEEFYSLEGGGE